MAIDVLVHDGAFPVETEVFTTLLGESFASTLAPYRHAMTDGYIQLDKLEKLCRDGEVPLPLLFAPLPIAQAQVQTKTEKLLAGISRDTFAVGSRGKVELREIELIVKDLIRKQEYLRKYDPGLRKNAVVGLLRRPGETPAVDARRLMSKLGITHRRLHEQRNRAAALEYLVERLEANQILVARNSENFMPQRVRVKGFGGMTIKDSKVPYVFLPGGDDGLDFEPTGRKIFTLVLMAVLVARKIFQPVTWDGNSSGINPGWEYDIVGEVLMPADRVRAIDPSSLEDMKSASNLFHVTASAMTVRAMRLELIDLGSARDILDELRLEFMGSPKKPGGRRPADPPRAIRKYNGQRFVTDMISALDRGALSEGEFCRAVCLRKLKPSGIPELRAIVR